MILHIMGSNVRKKETIVEIGPRKRGILRVTGALARTGNPWPGRKVSKMLKGAFLVGKIPRVSEIVEVLYPPGGT